MGLPNDYLAKRVKPSPSAVNLSTEEGFLLSRMGNGIVIKELLRLCPWPEDQIFSLLESLTKKNALDWTESAAIPDHSNNPILQQLNEDERDSDLVNLDRDFRREILMKAQGLEAKNPYEILDIVKSASTHEIKIQYLALSKKFHPDRFFRKKLGHYKEKLDGIFSKIQKAYVSLKDPQQREIIDRMQLVHAAQKPKSKEQALKSVRALDPQFEKLAKAEKFYQDGMAQHKKQDFMNAYNSFALAAQTNPQKDLYKKAMEDSRPLMQKQKAAIKVEEARGASQMRLPEEMFQAAEEAIRLCAELPEAQLFWAKGVIELRKSEHYRTAKERLVRAKAALPKSAEACFLLGHIFLVLGEKKSAKREFEESLKRDPHYTAAKRQLEEL